MKKIKYFLLALLTLAIFNGCSNGDEGEGLFGGAGSKISGKWRATSVSGTVRYNLADLTNVVNGMMEEFDLKGLGLTFRFESGGKVYADLGDGDESGKYTFSNGTLTMTSDDTKDKLIFPAEIKDDELIFDTKGTDFGEELAYVLGAHVMDAYGLTMDGVSISSHKIKLHLTKVK